jgi:hypothetical protein
MFVAILVKREWRKNDWSYVTVQIREGVLLEGGIGELREVRQWLRRSAGLFR